MNECDASLGIGEAAERGRFAGLAIASGTQDTGERSPGQLNFVGWWGGYPNPLRICLLALGLVQGCGSREPEAMGDRFVESYYVAANLGEALQFAEGLAAKKIQDQQRLLPGQSGPQSSGGRRVSFSRIEKAVMEGKLFLRYEVRIEVQGGGSFRRTTLLALSQGPSGWRVTNFSETE